MAVIEMSWVQTDTINAIVTEREVRRIARRNGLGEPPHNKEDFRKFCVKHFTVLAAEAKFESYDPTMVDADDFGVEVLGQVDPAPTRSESPKSAKPKTTASTKRKVPAKKPTTRGRC